MAKNVRRIPLVARLARQYRERLTPVGQYLFCTTILLALLALDTRRTLILWLFAMAAGIFLAAAAFTLFLRSRARLDFRFPGRVTALRPVVLQARVSTERATPSSELRLMFRRSRAGQPEQALGEVLFEPSAVFLEGDPDSSQQEAHAHTHARVEMRVNRRGRYVLRGPLLGRTDPLRLTVSRGVEAPEHALLVYPRYYRLQEFIVPLGRRYQPGGIPLSSSTGDAIEFAGTREYRPGDPVKNIHWRSSARRGEPVVKEYMEEYFCRIAIIVDTFLPRKPRPGQEAGFEAAISVVASIADYFSRSEYIVDILAAGPDIYEVSAGRSLAYLENILDVLACLGPCHDPPFAGIGPPLFEKLSQITTVVAVLQDWDAPREDFLRQVKAMGTAVRAIIVHDGPTQQPWEHSGEDIGELSVISPDDVERLLAQEYARA